SGLHALGCACPEQGPAARSDAPSAAQVSASVAVVGAPRLPGQWTFQSSEPISSPAGPGAYRLGVAGRSVRTGAGMVRHRCGAVTASSRAWQPTAWLPGDAVPAWAGSTGRM